MQEYLKFDPEKVNPDYREMVDRYFKDMDGENFQNHSIFHAWYVFKKILEYAHRKQQDVAIMSGTLRADFFNALVGDFKKILEAGNSVRVIVTEDLDRGSEGHANEIIDVLTKSAKGKIYVAKKQQDQEDKSGERYSLPHLLVCADGGCYRLETNTKSHSSIVAFGDHEFGGMLCAFFNDYVDANVTP